VKIEDLDRTACCLASDCLWIGEGGGEVFGRGFETERREPLKQTNSKTSKAHSTHATDTTATAFTSRPSLPSLTDCVCDNDHARMHA